MRHCKYKNKKVFLIINLSWYGVGRGGGKARHKDLKYKIIKLPCKTMHKSPAAYQKTYRREVKIKKPRRALQHYSPPSTVRDRGYPNEVKGRTF